MIWNRQSIGSLLHIALVAIALLAVAALGILYQYQATRIAIWDQAVGIPPDIGERIFDPNAPTTRPGTEGELGTGFGMPLVQRFVHAYGGEIEVVSRERTPGVSASGTEVTLTLLKPESSHPSEVS